MKWSKLCLIDLTLMLTFVVVCFCGNHYYRVSHTSLQLVESSHNISIIYYYKILPPVHSKLMSHYQLSNFAIYGLEHLETDTVNVLKFRTL